jgi:type I restriction enzyme S subunit
VFAISSNEWRKKGKGGMSMGEWKETTFGEFVDCTPTIKLKKGTFVENCEMEDIDPNYKFLYPQEGKSYEGGNSKFMNGDTVFARITPCLENSKIAQIRGLKGNVGIGSTEFFVFRGKNNVSDNDFVYYLSKSQYIVQSAVNSMSGASGRQRADLSFIKGLCIRVPEIDEQCRIASILSSYDGLIETNNKRIALLEESARELYKEWFVRFRFPGHEHTKFVKGLPEGWEEARIDKYYNTGSGGTPKSNVKEYYEDGTIRWINTGELHDNYLLDTNSKITQKGLSKSAAKVYPANTIVIAMYGATIGQLGIMAEECCTNQACCCSNA